MATHPRPLLGQLAMKHGPISRTDSGEALVRQQEGLSYVGGTLVQMEAVRGADSSRMLEAKHMLERDAQAGTDRCDLGSG